MNDPGAGVCRPGSYGRYGHERPGADETRTRPFDVRGFLRCSFTSKKQGRSATASGCAERPADDCRRRDEGYRAGDEPESTDMPISLLQSIVAALVASACLGSAASAEPLPAPVRKAIDAASANCRPQKVTLEKGFVTTRDVNGDGIPDYVVNYESFRCGDSFTFYCGSAGCLTQVFASTGGTYVKVLDENVEKIAFETVRGRPAILLGLHGSACGRPGVEPCGTTLVWNGTRFRSVR